LPKDFQDIRNNLISFFIGGASCRWNNVQMVEALTRVVTGFKVTAKMEIQKDLREKLESLPKPLNGNSSWKNANLVDPLEAVGEVGTAEAFKNLVPPPYRIVFKTGTIEERYEQQESEMLFFVIGRWDPHGDGFVAGETLSCYLYMQNAKEREGSFQKFNFARPIIQRTLDYLRSRAK